MEAGVKHANGNLEATVCVGSLDAGQARQQRRRPGAVTK
jgi:hypothetical protein